MIDDRFKRGALEEILAQLESPPASFVQHPDVERAKALVGLRASDEAMMRRGPEKADHQFDGVESKVRSTLVLNPADSFLWLMLYSVTTTRNGFDTVNIGFLAQSYSTGPLESWIALQRNRVALAVFAMLDEAMQQRSVSEFVALVDSRFIAEASGNLTGVGWAWRERLLAGLGETDIVSREALAKRLARDGVMVSIPGVELDERWWRR
ncbi:hypothetical protein [Bradyrhizobium sp. CCGE-LA001]|uniref:hypothetical protein n=1 Tax=Bradyrhizobium sp. CCGE-LA001 TaxID=1223566 RepID=UPI0011982646|nr:hypothetical protein [Bradyrhizobium sp. CCGE-LA001]